MYKPPHFTEKDRDEIVKFIQEYPFVTLIAHDGQFCQATQIPVLIDERDGNIYLTGHISRHTTHSPALEKSSEVLVLFTGPHCYVSASWYTSRGQASTWNYMNVQARGAMRWFTDEETLQLLKDLTHKYEHEQTQPELVESMSDGYLAANIKAIAGFEIAVTQLDATFKLSQNRDDESYKTIVNNLMAGDDIQGISVAGEMMRRRPNLFE